MIVHLRKTKVNEMIQFIRSKAHGFKVYLKCRLAKNAVLVLGDSHAAIFNHPNFRRFFPDVYFYVCSVGGATVSGLENPNSKTDSRRVFESALKVCRHRKSTIVMLGEVDTGFVIWYRAAKYNESVDMMLKNAVIKYERFIQDIKKYNEVIVISTPLPTIHDGDKGKVANLRKEVTTTLKERTELTLKFNALIESFCLRQNVAFLSLDHDSLGQDGLVNPELLNEDPTDHHYDQLKYMNLLIPKLGAYLL